MNSEGFVKLVVFTNNVQAEFVRPSVVELEEDIKDVLGEEALKSAKHTLRMTFADGHQQAQQAGVVRVKSAIEEAFDGAVTEEPSPQAPPSTEAAPPLTAPAAPSSAVGDNPTGGRQSKFKR